MMIFLRISAVYIDILQTYLGDELPNSGSRGLFTQSLFLKGSDVQLIR